MQLPDEIIIELTKVCNLDCDFCFNKQGKPCSDDISLEDVMKIIKDAHSSGIKAVRFTGGEPFMRSDLSEILKYAKSLGLFVIINTNGRLIDENNIRCFNYVDLVLFSFHDLSWFDDLNNKIDLLKDYNLKIIIATIALKRNITILEDYYKLISSIEQKNFLEWFVLRPIPNRINPRPVEKEDIKLLCSKIEELNKRYNLNVSIANSLPFCSVKGDISKICKGGKFDSGHTRLVIDSEGNYKTDYFSEVIGSIKDSGMLDIWNSDKLVEVRSCEAVPDECKKCSYLDKCKSGLLYKEYLRDFNTFENNNINQGIRASVIIPTFNNPIGLSLLIKSLENQTCNDFQIVVVDDGSIDDTKQIVEMIAKSSSLDIRYYYLDNTSIFGAGIARNYGAQKANGEVLIFLDNDMVAHSKLVENHLKEQANKDVVLGYIAGYGNKKYKYDIAKLKQRVENKEKIKPIIADFRNKLFKDPDYVAGAKDAWKFFCSGNFSIKRELFLNFRFDEAIKQWGGVDIEFGYRLINKGYLPKLSKICLSYDSSARNMIDKNKFKSSIRVLIYIFDKYKTNELKEYVLERFFHTSLSIRGNAKLDYNPKNNLFNFKVPLNPAFIRIDDVYEKSKNLLSILEYTIKNKIPVNLQLVPGLLDKNLIEFLKRLEKEHSGLISINQHGLFHKNYGLDSNKENTPGLRSSKYEFGPSRSYSHQLQDITEGKKIMDNEFGNSFSKIFTPPFYGYDENTLRVLSESGFGILSLHSNVPSNKNINCNGLIRLNSNLDLIKHYDPDEFFTDDELLERLDNIIKNEMFLGIVLHPFRVDNNELDKLKRLVDFAQENSCQFYLMEDIQKLFFPNESEKGNREGK